MTFILLWPYTEYVSLYLYNYGTHFIISQAHKLLIFFIFILFGVSHCHSDLGEERKFSELFWRKYDENVAHIQKRLRFIFQKFDTILMILSRRKWRLRIPTSVWKIHLGKNNTRKMMNECTNFYYFTNISPGPLRGLWKNDRARVVALLGYFQCWDGCIVEVVCWRVYRIVEHEFHIQKSCCPKWV